METGTQHGDPFASRSSGSPATEDAKQKATELTQTARQRALSTLDGQKEQLSGLLDRVAETAEGDRLGGYASDYARRGAEYLRRHSADEIVGSVRDGIRSRPGLLLSACFVAGLVVARMLRRDDGAADQDWRGDRGAWREEDLERGSAWGEDRP
jgi:hypothetical protein